MDSWATVKPLTSSRIFRHGNRPRAGQWPLRSRSYHPPCAILDGDLMLGTGQLRTLGDGGSSRIPPPSTAATSARAEQPLRSLLELHTCAIRDNGDLVLGRDYYGQLGDGETTRTPTHLQPAVDLTGQQLRSLPYTCAVLDNGELKCWGRINTDSWAWWNSIHKRRKQQHLQTRRSPRHGSGGRRCVCWRTPHHAVR